jgi:serine protein kinase
MSRSSKSIQEILGVIEQSMKKEFDSNRTILSYDEYLAIFAENPERHARGSAHWAADMMDFFGREEVPARPGAATSAPRRARGQADDHHAPTVRRFKLFDLPVDGVTPRVVGQEDVQGQIYRVLRTFARQGINNKLLLLHGPNGSAKSSIAHSIMGGMERYSNESEGALYSFNWVFPVERYTKPGLGINTYASGRETVANYAKLPDEEVASRVPCDMHDHPLLLIPLEQRREFLAQLLGEDRAIRVWEQMPLYLTKGGPCHRCKMISDAILVANGGDFRKLLMHIQVERLYLTRRYRRGLVTIEPQMHVDAQFHQLTYNKSIATLPAALQNLNLFTLTGDLVDGNRGLIEYSDLLKRPVDTFKYLLGACETGSVGVGSAIAYLDAVMIGSTNEVQLDAFKEFPDFTSFKARIELIRVPYLLSSPEEMQIYAPQLEQVSVQKHVAPHVDWVAALWSVLTRLKKPNSINYPPNVSTIVSNLSPLDKARLYGQGEMPAALSPEDKKLLRASLRKLKEEYQNIPYYEGRMGASAREMKSIIYDAAQNQEYPCLTPLAVFREIEEFVKRVTEYEFLKQDVKDGYHDAPEFVNTVRSEYLSIIDREVRDSIGLYDSAQWEDFLRKYIQQISHVLKREKVKNPLTGKMEEPDPGLIQEFEKIVEAPEDSAEKEAYRQNILSSLGAWSLDHPGEPMVYAKVFPEFWKKLEKHYFESQKAVLAKMSQALLVMEPDKSDVSSEGAKLANKTIENMKTKHGYCDECAREIISFLMKQKY